MIKNSRALLENNPHFALEIKALSSSGVSNQNPAYRFFANQALKPVQEEYGMQSSPAV